MNVIRNFLLILFSVAFLWIGNVKTNAVEWDLIQVTEKDVQKEPLQTNKTSRQLLSTISIPIHNRSLIDLLNQSEFSTKFFSFGTEATIHLGRWPLTFEADDTSLLHNFHQLAHVQVDGNEIRVEQHKNSVTDGALTKKIDESDEVKQLILDHIEEQMDLPVQFSVTYEKSFTLRKAQHVKGNYALYIPAIYAQGSITFADVYFQMEGKTSRLLLKNKFKEPIGAWVPVENYIVMEKNNR